MKNLANELQISHTKQRDSNLFSFRFNGEENSSFKTNLTTEKLDL